MRCVVAGAGGFIGGHLVKSLLSQGHEVLAGDIKHYNDWCQVHDDAINYIVDCRSYANNLALCEGVDQVYNLAADMGGMGYLANNRVNTLNSVLITANLINAASDVGVRNYWYASSACVYPDFKQQTEIVSLKESDAWPADPEACYGLEKLYGEEYCKWLRLERGMNTQATRFHNIFGPYGTYDGGREKAPAAICRKVIEYQLGRSDGVEIWGDGEQTRSFLYVDECIEGIYRIVRSGYPDPLNLGSDELVSINQLVSMVEEIAGVTVPRSYDLSAPQGVRGRNSDNTKIKEVLNWAPSAKLYDGLEKTYRWIYDEMN